MFELGSSQLDLGKRVSLLCGFRCTCLIRSPKERDRMEYGYIYLDLD